MQAGMIDMEVNTTLVQCYPAHEALPDGPGPFPTVVIIHDEFGLNTPVKVIANRLAREGFYVVAPDFYATPTSFAGVAPDYMRVPGGGALDDQAKDEAELRAARLSDSRADEIFRQAIGYLGTRAHAQPGGVGVLGFSMGGRISLSMACRHAADVRACVAFYPTDVATASVSVPGQSSHSDPFADAQAPLLLFYGALDTGIRSTEREQLRARLAALGKDAEVIVFPGAEHDFFRADSDAYSIGASRTAWSKTLALYRRALT